MINIVENICPRSNWANKCPYEMKAEYITIHNTANDASAKNEIAYMNRNTNQCSFHFAIDNEEVVQGIPVNRNAWHAGDGSNGPGNRKSIAIEICYSKSGGKKFEQAEILASKFVAQLLHERGWTVAKVKKHQDWSGKYCPHRTLDLGWQRFINMIDKELKSYNKVNPDIRWYDVARKTMHIKSKTNLVNLDNGSVIKVLEGNFTFSQATFNNEYVRTDYSKLHNINNGVLMSDLEEIKAPIEELEVDNKITGETGCVDILNIIINFIKSIISQISKK
jgi:N-acetylmuramoyl-L-alanine amidase CwlA